MNLDEIYKIVCKEIEIVDTKIKDTIPQKADAFRDACLQILNGKSKRIRPALVLLCSKMLHLKGKRIINLATAVEIFHTATLVHDDIIDASTLRRGTETINAKFGVHSAILVADYLYLNGAILLNNVFDGNQHLNKELSRLILSTANKMFSGELNQLLKNSVFISRKEYLNIISQKTASFFSACCTIPSLLTKSNNIQKRALLLYGRNLGLAFQIMDDILDIIGDEKKFGKKMGSDLKEGFFTLPMVHFYENATINEKKKFLDLLTKKRRNVKNIIELINRHNSITYARNMAKTYSKKAKNSIGLFPDSEAKRSLIGLCDFVVERDH
ncbi:MAG: polyprenyl synthetase family protein [Candidatus Cloacimonadota bacterium]|nr:MAG: polyprenyl synthetase family protein [Candidatus Cloacimonadota bacterium]